MKLGAVSVEMGNGEIRNKFEEVRLGKHHGVLVPTLVLVTDNEIEPMFKLSTEASKTSDRRIRIMANCVSDECVGLFLVDETDRNATEFFTPQSGLKLSSAELPSIHAHAFGLIGLALGDVPDLYEEATSEPWVGHVIRV